MPDEPETVKVTPGEWQVAMEIAVRRLLEANPQVAENVIMDARRKTTSERIRTVLLHLAGGSKD